MGNRRLIGIYVSALMSAAASPSPAGTGFIVSGYWKWMENPDADHERHIRISGDSGFYCVLDGKSSFAFAIGADSLTTPMNGKNQVVWMPGSGDLVITGSEKGVPYSDRFSHSDSAAYWGKCRAEERAWTPSARVVPGREAGALRAAASGLRAPGFAWKSGTWSATGRSRPDGR